MKRLVTGIKPTGELTLGNYLGALLPLINLQKELPDTEFFVFVADLHALTTKQVPADLRRRIRSIAALYLACGLNENNLNLFVQSEVQQHLQLGYIMQSNVYIGELERMTQFKSLKQKNADAISASLLTYPALMAADILLYDATIIPVGDDQRQHLELTRDLALRFNNLYSETFVIPNGHIPKIGARIKSLTNPTKKMSKSETETSKSYILLLDNVNEAKNKIKSAVTDSIAIIQYDELNQPGLANLIQIFAALSNNTTENIVAKYQDSNYATFKNDLAELVGTILEEIQKRYQTIISSNRLDEILDKGRIRAINIAQKKMTKVYKKIGLNRQ